MQGHCIAIDITDIDFQLYCHPGTWGIRLSRNPPTRDVDATISGRLMALVNLASLDDKVSTSIQERVSFQGNIALAQKLQKILHEFIMCYFLDNASSNTDTIFSYLYFVKLSLRAMR